MSDTNWFEIVDGVFALALVDRNDAGYSDSWMAPSGKTVSTVALVDYNMPALSSWHCQLMKGAITARSGTRTRTRRATFCGKATTVATAIGSSFNLDLEIAQDPHITDGLSQFLHENDAAEAYFLLGLNDTDPPKAIGRVILTAGAFGGAADEDLTATVSMLLKSKPSIAWGSGS